MSAGPDVAIAMPPTDTVALGGPVTDDGLPFGAALSSFWTQVSGPAPVAFADPTSPFTSATFSTAGVYELKLTASDTTFSSSDDVVVTVVTGRARKDAAVTRLGIPSARGVAGPRAGLSHRPARPRFVRAVGAAVDAVGGPEVEGHNRRP